MTVCSANVCDSAAGSDQTNPATEKDWILWQLADSAFPAGSFAHSGGVEAAWQHGRVRTADDVQAFLIQVVHQVARGIVPFMTASFDEPGRGLEWDEWLDATLSSHVANRASRLQGQALLATAEKVFDNDGLKEFRKAAMKVAAPCHLAVAFGVIASALEISRNHAVKLFLFLTMRGVLSAAVRLGIVGPLQAQRIQSAMNKEMEALARDAAQIAPADAAQTAPLLELMQSTQDRLYSRLFQS